MDLRRFDGYDQSLGIVTMYATCLFCVAPLGENEVIESFPVGRRLAFDPEKGRLWVVCRQCERWNLTPLEERWEAVEDCERQFRRTRKRVSTENIGLARLDQGLELVRIGDPLRPEFAAWRYGDQFGRRRRRAARTITAAAVGIGSAAAGALSLGAAGLGSLVLFEAGAHYLRRRRNTRLVTLISGPDGVDLIVRGEHLVATRLAPDHLSASGWRLVLAHEHGTLTLRDGYALQATSVIMPAINRTGGTQANVDRAIRRLERFTDPLDYLRSAAAESFHDTRPGTAGALPGLPSDMRLAIEMAVNDENERFALEGELWFLEEAWRQAEEIAAIADELEVAPGVMAKLEALRARRRALPARRHPPFAGKKEAAENLRTNSGPRPLP